MDHLLRTGANVHARDDGGLIPLHNACSFGHSEVRSCPVRVAFLGLESLIAGASFLTPTTPQTGSHRLFVNDQILKPPTSASEVREEERNPPRSLLVRH